MSHLTTELGPEMTEVDLSAILSGVLIILLGAISISFWRIPGTLNALTSRLDVIASRLDYMNIILEKEEARILVLEKEGIFHRDHK